MGTINKQKWSIKVSLTPHCNFRCFYCNDYSVNPRKIGENISINETEDILRAAYENGIKKVQWTGGECTIIDLPRIAKATKRIGFLEQSLVTNGMLLHPMLDNLIESGLNRANISLDTLSRDKFKEITGVDGIQQVKKSIEYAAEKLELTKINVAVMRKNVNEISDLAKYAGMLGSKVILKLHELWKFLPSEEYAAQHVPLNEIMKCLTDIGDLNLQEGIRGNNPTVKYYKIGEGDQIVGVSGIPVHFMCGGPNCSKIRVYANGRTCDGKHLAGADYKTKRELVNEIIERRSSSLIDRDIGYVEKPIPEH